MTGLEAVGLAACVVIGLWAFASTAIDIIKGNK